MQGEIPCDLPNNTRALLLADIGMTGNFSFQTLLERAPSMFNPNGRCACRGSAWQCSDRNSSAAGDLVGWSHAVGFT